MSDPKILFLDIDDTLLNSAKKITPGVADAISRALAKGHKIVITTGRPVAAASAFIEELGLTSRGCYAICYNGGLIWDCFRRETVFCVPLPMEDVRYIFGKAAEAGIHIQTYDNTAVLSAADDDEIRGYLTRTRMPFRLEPGLPGSLTESPVKMLMIDTHERLEEFRESVSDYTAGRMEVIFSTDNYLEFVKAGISKGSAVRRLAGMLGIPMENTIAAGDSENDLPMILEAGIGCAMANATEEVKAAADYVTENDCDHDGVAEIIERFLEA